MHPGNRQAVLLLEVRHDLIRDVFGVPDFRIGRGIFWACTVDIEENSATSNDVSIFDGGSLLQTIRNPRSLCTGIQEIIDVITPSVELQNMAKCLLTNRVKHS